jgi:hypothetical protein
LPIHLSPDGARRSVDDKQRIIATFADQQVDTSGLFKNEVTRWTTPKPRPFGSNHTHYNENCIIKLSLKQSCTFNTLMSLLLAQVLVQSTMDIAPA